MTLPREEERCASFPCFADIVRTYTFGARQPSSLLSLQSAPEGSNSNRHSSTRSPRTRLNKNRSSEFLQTTPVGLWRFLAGRCWLFIMIGRFFHSTSTGLVRSTRFYSLDADTAIFALSRLPFTRDPRNPIKARKRVCGTNSCVHPQSHLQCTDGFPEILFTPTSRNPPPLPSVRQRHLRCRI